MNISKLDAVVKKISGRCFFDYVTGQIIKEEDMRTSFYYHFRRWIEANNLQDRIQIYVNPSVKLRNGNKFPDIVIYSDVGNIYFEFKLEGDMKKRLKKDRKTLSKLNKEDSRFVRGWIIHFNLNENEKIKINLPKVKQIAYPDKKFRVRLNKKTKRKFDWTPINLFIGSKKYWVAYAKQATFNLVDNSKLSIKYLSDIRKLIGKCREDKAIEIIRKYAKCSNNKAQDIYDILVDYETAYGILKGLYTK